MSLLNTLPYIQCHNPYTPWWWLIQRETDSSNLQSQLEYLKYVFGLTQKSAVWFFTLNAHLDFDRCDRMYGIMLDKHLVKILLPIHREHS